MMRSAPALSLKAVAAGIGMPVSRLKLAMESLKGRERCAELASSMSRRRCGHPRKRSMVTQSAMRLTTDHPSVTERLAAATPHPTVLAVLIAADDDNTHSIAAGREDLIPAQLP